MADPARHELRDLLVLGVLQQEFLEPRDVLPDELGDCKVPNVVQNDLLNSLFVERLILGTGVIAQHKRPYRLRVDVQQEFAEGVILHPQYDEQLSIFARHAGVPVGLRNDLGVVQHESQNGLMAEVAQQELSDGRLPALSALIESAPEVSEEPMEELLESSFVQALCYELLDSLMVQVVKKEISNLLDVEVFNHRLLNSLVTEVLQDEFLSRRCEVLVLLIIRVIANEVPQHDPADVFLAPDVQQEAPHAVVVQVP